MWRGRQSPRKPRPPPDYGGFSFFGSFLMPGENGQCTEQTYKSSLCAVCVCRKWVALRVDPDDLERHTKGMFVQFAFTDCNGTPYLSPAERELFISACCGSCWDLLCADPTTHPMAYN